MKKHIGVALGFCLSLTLLSVSSVSSAAPQIAGTKCQKVGALRTAKSVKFQCVKSAKGLRWVIASTKGTSTTTTTSTTIPLPTQPVTSLTDTSQLASSNLCKLQYSGSDWSGGLVRTGFPRVDDAFLPPGDVLVQVVPVDYPNVQWVKSPNEVLQSISAGVTDYYKKVSNGRLNFTWRLATATVRMPYNAEHYNLGPTSGNNGFAFAKEAVLYADPLVDFSGADFVLILNPDTVTRDQIYSSPAQQSTRRWATSTNEGLVFRTTFTSHYTNNNMMLAWRIIAHEFAHGMGLPDLYRLAGSTQEYMGQFDLMATTFGALELTAWSKWQLSFIGDNQVLCLRQADEGNFWISHVSAGSLRPELILIRESDTTAIAIEARRKERFDKDAALTTVIDGLLVYRIDTAFESGSGPLRIIRKIGSTSPTFLDSLLGPNDSLTIGGQVIRTIEVGGWGHVVRVSRTP